MIVRFHDLLWLGALVIGSSLIAVASAYLHRAGLSPIVLFSLLIGAACGAVAVASALLFDVRNRWFLFVGALAMAVFVAAAQHVVLHRLQLSDWRQAQLKEPQLPLFRPPPEELMPYLRREAAGGRAWLWLLDGAIVTATAAGIAAGMKTSRGEVNME